VTVTLRIGMCLAVGVVVAVLGISAAGAEGRVRALAIGDVIAGPAFAGDRVLWGQSSASPTDASGLRVAFRLRSVRVTGDRVVTVLRRVLEGRDPTWLGLDASPSRAALAVTSDPRDPGTGRPRVAFALAGPPGGPFELVAGTDSPERPPPEWLRVAVADDVLITAEGPPDRVLVHRPGAPPAQLTPPDGAEAAGMVAEGGFIAFPVHRAKDDPRSPGIAVMDLATGAERYGVAMRGGLFDLQADGKVAVLDAAGLAWASPAEPRPHRIRLPGAVRPTELQLARDRMVIRVFGPPVPTGGTGTTADRLLLVNLDGRVAPVTPRSASLRGFAYDGRRLAWSAGGCVMVSDLRGRVPTAIPRGPCPRAETVLEDLPPLRLSPRRNAFRAWLSCISAPRDECRGVVRLMLDDRRRRDHGARIARTYYRLGAGRRGSVRLTVPARRLHRLGRATTVRIEARTRDPQGRISIAAVTTSLSTRAPGPGPSTPVTLAGSRDGYDSTAR
jgi:hypothetical protein